MSQYLSDILNNIILLMSTKESSIALWCLSNILAEKTIKNIRTSTFALHHSMLFATVINKILTTNNISALTESLWVINNLVINATFEEI